MRAARQQFELQPGPEPGEEQPERPTHARNSFLRCIPASGEEASARSDESALDGQVVEAMLVLWGEYPHASRDALYRGYWQGAVKPAGAGWPRGRVGAVCTVYRRVEAALQRMDPRLVLILRQKYQWGLSDAEARQDVRMALGRQAYVRERQRAVYLLGRMLNTKTACTSP